MDGKNNALQGQTIQERTLQAPTPRLPGGPPPENWTVFTFFTGKGIEYFGIMLYTYIRSAFTMGIYSFWGRTMARQYLWSHTLVLDEPLEYTGTGKELFLSFLLVMPMFLIGALFFSFLGVVSPFLLLGVYPLLLFLWQFASYRALRYRLTRTRWRGIRGNMSGSAVAYAGKACLYWLAVLCSLGLLLPWATARMAGLRLNNIWFGNRKVQFDGPARELFKSYLLCLGACVLLTVVCGGAVYWSHQAYLARPEQEELLLLQSAAALLFLLGASLFFSFYRAACFRWLCRHVTCGNVRLRSNLTGMRFFRVMLTNLLLFSCTLGLAWAWMHIRSLRLNLNSISYTGDPALGELLQDTQSAPSRGEGLLEALDVDIAL